MYMFDITIMSVKYTTSVTQAFNISNALFLLSLCM
jgi:hypothetical protein